MNNKIIVLCILMVAIKCENIALGQIRQGSQSISCSLGYVSDETYSFILDYKYYLRPFFGVGGGIFLNSQSGNSIQPHGDLNSEGKILAWKSETKVTNPGGFISIVGEFPVIIRERGIMLEFEPAWLLMLPRTSSIVELQNVNTGVRAGSDRLSVAGGQWNAWLLRSGLSFRLGDRLMLSLSYSITNLDSYSTYRLLEYEGKCFNDFYPEKKPFVHMISVGVRLLL